MALVLGDGFDHYPTALVLNKWDTDATYEGGSAGVTIGTTYGRLGSQGVKLYGSTNGGLIKNIYTANSSYGFLGAAVYVPSYGAFRREIFSLYDSTDTFAHTQVTVTLELDGSFIVCYRDGGGGYGTVLALSSPGQVAAATWNYIEAKMKVHDTTGSVEIRVNEAVVLTATNINTRHQTSNNYFTRVGLGGTSGFSATWESTYFDDFYYCDDTGAINNSYLGDVQLQAIYPNGVGSSTGWTIGGSAPAATNWQSVNEHSPDDDVTLVKSSVVNTLDMYTMDDITATAASVKGLLINARIKKDDATARSYSTMVKDVLSGGATTAVAVRTTPFGAYTNQQDVSQTSPTTGALWTVAEVNAMEAGLKVIT